MIGNLQKLQYLISAQNNFNGNIPSSLGNLTKLLGLELHDNNLQGSIPSNLSQCKNLLTFCLDDNNLSGTISPQIIGLSFHQLGLTYLETNSLVSFLGNRKF